MPEVTFYKHRRMDNGTRYGIALNQRTIFHRYDRKSDDDPVLQWYIDVRLLGSKIPSDAKGIKHWLLMHGDFIRKGLQAHAKGLSARIVSRGYPIIFDLPEAPDGIYASIVVSAALKLSAADIASELMALHDEWAEVVGSIPRYKPSRAAS